MNETTNPEVDPGYNKFIEDLKNASDNVELQHQIVKEQILKSEQLSDEDRELFTLVVEYCEKIAKQNKQLEPNLLKIYLEDIHGKDISEIRILRILMLVIMSGITF